MANNSQDMNQSERSLFGAPNTVSFARKLAASRAFNAIFKEGMGLVESAAAYLDGDGRLEAKALPRMAALAYATESMRLTTRLMQVASWLLLQRAVNEGELTFAQAATEKHKVALSRQDTMAAPEAFEALPERLRDLTVQSLRLQERIIHLDQMLYESDQDVAGGPALSALASQMESLRSAFAMTGT